MMLSVLPYSKLIAALLLAGLTIVTVWPTRPAPADVQVAKSELLAKLPDEARHGFPRGWIP